MSESLPHLLLRQHHLSGDVTTIPSLLPPAPTPFVGREEAVLTLRRRLLAGPRLVFLTGPDGIGKTSLAVAVAHHMLQAGYFGDGVLWIDAREVLSYGGLLDALARQLGHHAAVGRSIRQREQYLQQQILDHNYLLVVDDLDALAEGRRRAVFFLRQLNNASLVTTRLHPAGLDEPERVGPLTLRESYEVLQALTSTTLPFDQVEGLLRQIHGSPLATRLLAAQLQTRQDPTDLTGRLLHIPTGELRFGRFHGQPPHVLRALLVALEGLDEAEHDLLLAASCLHRSFSPELLAFVLERADPAEVLVQIEQLQARGLVEQKAHGWRVHNALIDALEARVPHPERWHRRAAAARTLGTTEDLLLAASHLRRAGDAPGAARLLITHRDDLLDHGLDSQLAEQMATFSPEEVTRDQWRHLSEVQGDVAMRLRQFWEANHYYSRALGEVAALPDAHEARRAAIRLARKQAEVALVQTSRAHDEFYEQAREWLHRALGLARRAQPEELVRLALLQSRLREIEEQPAAARRAAEGALRLARQHHVEAMLLPCYRRIGHLYHQADQLQGALAAYESALALVARDPAREPRQHADLLCEVAALQRALGNWVDAIASLEASLPLWRTYSLGSSLARTLYELSYLFVRQGRFVEAQRYLQEAEVVARRLNMRALAVLTQALQAEMLLYQDDPQLADAILQASLEAAQHDTLIEPVARLFLLKAEAARQRGAEEEMRRLFEEAKIWARRSNDPRQLTRVHVQCALADDTVPALDNLLPLLDDPRLLFERMRVQLRLAELLAPTDRRRARTMLSQASDALARLGARPEVARVAALWARIGS